MDDDLLKLADRLSAVAGMIMEDYNMLTIAVPASTEDRIAALDTLQGAAEDMTRLIAAAKVLTRLSP